MNALQPEILFTPKEPTVFSVSEISQQLKRHVETQFAKVRVKGEISGLKLHTSGHAYYTLKDNDAVIDAVTWRGTPLGMKLEDGIEVIASGRLTTYPGRSKYQMVVERCEIAGEGALLKLLQERKRKLHAEGVFSQKRALPAYPQIIGVVTSPTGAVIRDILHRLQDRFPCHVIVWPVLVQGPGAAEQVAAAVDGFNQLHENRPDILIIARGGGSLEDLWAFNEEVVVRAVFNSKIPTISAIGHETDTTLIDYTADVRAPTPTAAAELATPVIADMRNYLTTQHARMTQLTSNMIRMQHLRLRASLANLPRPQDILFEKNQRFDDWNERLKYLETRLIIPYAQQFSALSARLKFPKESFQEAMGRLTLLEQRLKSSTANSINTQQQRHDLLTLRLKQNSFEHILQRGFSLITDPNGNLLSKTSDFKDLQPLKITVADGNVQGEFRKQ